MSNARLYRLRDDYGQKAGTCLSLAHIRPFIPPPPLATFSNTTTVVDIADGKRATIAFLFFLFLIFFLLPSYSLPLLLFLGVFMLITE